MSNFDILTMSANIYIPTTALNIFLDRKPIFSFLKQNVSHDCQSLEKSKFSTYRELHVRT
jgi:hypothetical protein